MKWGFLLSVFLILTILLGCTSKPPTTLPPTQETSPQSAPSAEPAQPSPEPPETEPSKALQTVEGPGSTPVAESETPALTTQTPEMKSDRFYLDNKPWFIVGANWRAVGYGENFGTCIWYGGGKGISYHISEVNTELALMKDTGIKVIRIGLLDDGRNMFDKEGHIIGYTEVFKRDVKILLDLAAKHQLKIEFTLVDNLVGQPSHQVGDVWLGWPCLFNDEEIRKEFIDEFLKPFLKDFGNHVALMSIDVINEPEWGIIKSEGGGCEDPTKSVPLEAINTFIIRCIDTIHQQTPQIFTTVGVSISFGELVVTLPIDYFALHYYPWMGDLYSRLNDVKEGVESLPETKPWVLEEYPTRGSDLDIASYLDAVLEAGGRGALLWNWTPGCDDSTSSGDLHLQQSRELQAWVNAHP